MKCSTCGEYYWTSNHTCQERWLCRQFEYGDDWNPVYCNSGARAAVEKYCKANFSNWDYPSIMEIEICKDEDSEIEIYDVDVAPVPDFSASLRK
jgi:hypothetical protein